MSILEYISRQHAYLKDIFTMSFKHILDTRVV